MSKKMADAKKSHAGVRFREKLAGGAGVENWGNWATALIGVASRRRVRS